MAANTARVFAVTPNIGAIHPLLSTAMTNTKAYDGTETAGTALALIYTAGANGGSPGTCTIRYTSTDGATASGTTSATVVRFWINNASANTTATNNQLEGEVLVPAATLVALATSINPIAGTFIFPTIPAGYRIYAGTTVAVGGTNAALTFGFDGGDF